jgi:hypothetical protein
VRRLAGPAGCRLSEGDHTPEALFELFWDWQKNTNSIFWNGPFKARDSKWMSGSAERRNRCQEAYLPTVHPESTDLRALPSAPRTPVPPLDKDLHGCREFAGPRTSLSHRALGELDQRFIAVKSGSARQCRAHSVSLEEDHAPGIPIPEGHQNLVTSRLRSGELHREIV